MKEQWKSWFLDRTSPEDGFYMWPDRSYSYTNIKVEDVPFHEHLKGYIFNLSPITQGTTYTEYHLHEWQPGDFFAPHIDNNFHRKWAYVCEIKPSACRTTLMVNEKPMREGIFDSNTIHEVPRIEEGTRFSVTVFGSPIKSVI